MRTPQFWRTHKWHQLSNVLYWLAGIRTSILHIILFSLTFVAARPLLANAPGWIFQLIAIEHIFRNNWMHMNVVWRSTRLEWLIVTHAIIRFIIAATRCTTVQTGDHY